MCEFTVKENKEEHYLSIKSDATLSLEWLLQNISGMICVGIILLNFASSIGTTGLNYDPNLSYPVTFSANEMHFFEPHRVY